MRWETNSTRIIVINAMTVMAIVIAKMDEDFPSISIKITLSAKTSLDKAAPSEILSSKPMEAIST